MHGLRQGPGIIRLFTVDRNVKARTEHRFLVLRN